METIKSQINFNYETIKITKSRLSKGLLAIPVSLIDVFPKKKAEIKILFENNIVPQLKSFTPYTSSSRECRIGGLAKWFKEMNFMDGDEIVIQIINKDENIYKLYKENHFINDIKSIEELLTSSVEQEIIDDNIDDKVSNSLELLSKKINIPKKEIIINEFLKIKDIPIKARIYKSTKINNRKENVPSFMRIILENIYDGHCQISNFTFLQKNGKPYFEIHHIDENRGNDWKNLLVVCPNIHAQFTYSKYENIFDNEGWLRIVKFENKENIVNQKLDKIRSVHFKKIVHY